MPLRPPVHRPRILRLMRLCRARIRLLVHRLYFVPTIRATMWMYFAAASLVGFGALESLIVVFALYPSAFPILLAVLAVVAACRNALRRSIRLLRRWRRRRR